MPKPANSTAACRVAVIWIDWYAYHVARFRGLDSASSLTGKVTGIELVGGIGVHAGLKFREKLPADLWIESLMPEGNWRDADKRALSVSLWRKLSELNPEVVLVPGYYTLPGICAAVWAKLHGRVSVLMTESTADDHVRVWWKEKLKAWLLAMLFDWAVVGGRAHTAYLETLGFPLSRIVESYDVVDNNFFAQGTAELRLGPVSEFDLPSRYFLFVGRLAEEKNVPQLVNEWLTYRRQGGTWDLVLVGDGPLRASLQALVDGCGFAAAIHFAGLRSSRELLPFYAFAGCFVLPSTREPWGLVVNEAMASGLPVLVSRRCGCVPDLVFHGENGFVFDPAIGELTPYFHLLESLPETEVTRMRERSSEIVRNYSPERFGSEIARVANFHHDAEAAAVANAGASVRKEMR